MTRADEMADRFWRQALRDLAIARQLLTPDGSYAAANYAHQAAEKALKACLWHLAGAEPPWSGATMLVTWQNASAK